MSATASLINIQVQVLTRLIGGCYGRVRWGTFPSPGTCHHIARVIGERSEPGYNDFGNGRTNNQQSFPDQHLGGDASHGVVLEEAVGRVRYLPAGGKSGGGVGNGGHSKGQRRRWSWTQNKVM